MMRYEFQECERLHLLLTEEEFRFRNKEYRQKIRRPLLDGLSRPRARPV